MAMRSIPRVRYNGQLLMEDAAAAGLDAKALADRANGALTLRTIYRFLSGEVQTVQTANVLAAVLGQPVGRYVARSEAVA